MNRSSRLSFFSRIYTNQFDVSKWIAKKMPSCFAQNYTEKFLQEPTNKSFHDTKPTRIQLFWHLWSGEKIQGRRQQFFQNIKVTCVIHTDTSERKGRGNETEEEESQLFCFACQEILTNMPKIKWLRDTNSALQCNRLHLFRQKKKKYWDNYG